MSFFVQLNFFLLCLAFSYRHPQTVVFPLIIFSVWLPYCHSQRFSSCRYFQFFLYFFSGFRFVTLPSFCSSITFGHFQTPVFLFGDTSSFISSLILVFYFVPPLLDYIFLLLFFIFISLLLFEPFQFMLLLSHCIFFYVDIFCLHFCCHLSVLIYTVTLRLNFFFNLLLRWSLLLHHF